MSRLPIKDNAVVSSLTGLSGKVTGMLEGGRNKSTIDKIKNMWNDSGSSSQKILTIKAILKYLIFSVESDHADVINMGK